MNRFDGKRGLLDLIDDWSAIGVIPGYGLPRHKCCVSLSPAHALSLCKSPKRHLLKRDRKWRELPIRVLLNSPAILLEQPLPKNIDLKLNANPSQIVYPALPTRQAMNTTFSTRQATSSLHSSSTVAWWLAFALMIVRPIVALYGAL
jgi:hypothetical protein